MASGGGFGGGGESLRGIVGAGPSKVGPVKAMRARDVSRPRPETSEPAPDDQSAGGDGSSGSSPSAS